MNDFYWLGEIQFIVFSKVISRYPFTWKCTALVFIDRCFTNDAIKNPITAGCNGQV